MGPWGRRVGTWWGRADVPILVRLGPVRPHNLVWVKVTGTAWVVVLNVRCMHYLSYAVFLVYTVCIHTYPYVLNRC